MENSLSVLENANAVPGRAPKTAELVAANLRRQIIRGDIAEGNALPAEQELMAEYKVSRPSLREALRILESEGLIVVRRGVHGGARAARPSIATAANYVGVLMQARGVTLADVFDARVWIEPAAAKLLSARRARTGAIRQLTALLDHELTVAGNAAAYLRATEEFHEQLIELSGNRTLWLLWQILHHGISIEFTDFEDAGPPRVEKRQERCRELIRLIGEGDGEAAEEYWRDQLMRARKWVIERHGGKTIVDMI
jgi:DNA-binding FadR family transcriptional regulator